MYSLLVFPSIVLFILAATDPYTSSYEIQISEAMRGMGVGRALMTMLEMIGSTWEMEKVKLTVLKGD
jgi:ribosomal protein S18 acetylase RimI-like enzyme